MDKGSSESSFSDKDDSELLSYLDIIYSKFDQFEYQYSTALAYMYIHHFSKFDEILHKGMQNLDDGISNSRYVKLHNKLKSGLLDYSENPRYGAIII